MSVIKWSSTPSGELDIQLSTWRLRASMPGPGSVKRGVNGHWTTPVGDATVGGVSGQVRQHHIADEDGWSVCREVFVAEDDSLIAVRMTVGNNASGTRLLHDFDLMHLEGDAALTGVGSGQADWRIVRMSRQKNDVPGNYRPGVNDTDMEHARIDGAELKAGRGVSADDLKKLRADPNTVRADPTLWIMPRDPEDDRPGLLLGVLGQCEHLAHLAISSDPETGGISCLRATCEFDAVEVPAGANRATHWLVIYEADNDETLRQRYASLFAREFGIAQPGPAPSMFCSWYFYGTDFTQDDLEENLCGLQERPIAFDTLLIDNGWMDDFGHYQANERFPDGMAHAAQRIADAGYQPGIWTCPFVVSHDSKVLERYPNLLARDCDGELMAFPYDKTIERVVDPTSPDAEPYIAEVFGRLRGWGYTVHKLDFLRSIIVSPRIRFHDRTMNRAQAYRRGMQLVRKYAGDDAYILACGGLFEASAGLADAVRIGSDTRGHWSDPTATNAYLRLGYLARIKQNFLRSHTNRLWHTDPDAMQLRRRSEPFRGKDEFHHLSEGSFTDDEAATLVANHYVGGGMVTLCERMAELPDDRYRLLRRALPAVTAPAQILDFEHPVCPTRLLTRVVPQAAGLSAWHTLTVFNWDDDERDRTFDLISVLGSQARGRYAVMELITQQVVGLFDAQQRWSTPVPAHGTRIFRITPVVSRQTVLLGTDGHLSGGAAEFETFEYMGRGFRCQTTKAWRSPLRLTFGRLEHHLLETFSVELPGDATTFTHQFETNPGERVSA